MVSKYHKYDFLTIEGNPKPGSDQASKSPFYKKLGVQDVLNDTTVSYEIYNRVYSNNKIQGGEGELRTTHASYLDSDSQMTETNF